jgi:hypothetical protein
MQDKIIIYERILFRINFPPAVLNQAAAEDPFSADVVPNYDQKKLQQAFWHPADGLNLRLLLKGCIKLTGQQLDPGVLIRRQLTRAQ